MKKPIKVLAIIPARGGSKGICNKNITELAGKPLIAHTIEAALGATLLSHCIVSTDSEEIAAICRKEGAIVPFLRPAELALDDTPTLPVILHALRESSECYDAVLILQPTSPFRRGEHIDAAITLLQDNKAADSVISVVRVGDQHPARMKRIEDGLLVDPPFAEKTEGQRRQDLPELYLRNGAIYLTRTEVLLSMNSFKGAKSLAYVMSDHDSVNIDSPFDLLVAETIAAQREVHS